jgi:hypothetical protein
MDLEPGNSLDPGSRSNGGLQDMAVQKSDAMVQHEKWIEEVLKTRPKKANDDVMHIEVRNYVLAAAGLLVIIFAAVAMMG